MYNVHLSDRVVGNEVVYDKATDDKVMVDKDWR